MKKLTLAICAILLLLGLAAPAQEAMKTYACSEWNFSMQYPGDWTAGNARGYRIAFYGPGKEYRVAVYAESSEASESLEQFLERIEGLHMKNCEGYEARVKRKGAIAGVEAWEKTYMYRDTSKDGAVHDIVGKDVYLRNGGIDYIIELTCTKQRFQTVAPLFSAMVKSFSFLP